MGITDPLVISPQTVYDFSADAEGSLPTTFPGGTFTTKEGEIHAVGSSWQSWNPPTAGIHVFFAYAHGIRFTTPQQAVGVVAEPNNMAPHYVTIQAFDFKRKLIGQYTQLIDGNGGAAFIGLASPLANISSVAILGDAEANGVAYTNLTYGSSLATFLGPLRPIDPKVFCTQSTFFAGIRVAFTAASTALTASLQVLDPVSTPILTATIPYDSVKGYYQYLITKAMAIQWPTGDYTLVVTIGTAVYRIPIRIYGPTYL